MSDPVAIRTAPPDQSQRESALDASRSILVQAPAGSGKTDLLTRRFLRLLGEVEDPGQIVAVTFTRAAAAEMRHRILSELEKAAAAQAPDATADEFSMQTLAHRALRRSEALGWQLIDLPAQLRIKTIDSFCRDLALQQPLLTELGGELDLNEHPDELYRRAARRTLEQLDESDPALTAALEALLLRRDNSWQEMETLLIEMLRKRDRWMHEFVLEREPDWDALRERLERPFANAVRESITHLDALLAQVPGAQNEAHLLSRYACEQSGGTLQRSLAELADFPAGPFTNHEELEDGRRAFLCVADLLLIKEGSFRQQVNKKQGFPADRKTEKMRHASLVQALNQVDGFEASLAALRDLPAARYTDEDWQIVQSSFRLLRHAVGELRTVFAESGVVDFIEVAQIALHVLQDEDGQPTDAAIALADGIRHLLVDEFQDTSRRQHQLLARLIAAWPESTGRTCFVVGDPMQSIYSFRDADAELFPRVRTVGLEIPPANDPFLFDFVPLAANFRTVPRLVEHLNEVFDQVFSAKPGNNITFARAVAAREVLPALEPHFTLHLEFAPRALAGKAADPQLLRQREASQAAQVEQIVDLIRARQAHIDEALLARRLGQDSKYRIAVLGRARKALEPIAAALRAAQIPFRAVELEQLQERPEVLDALALGRALLNPQDRVAWLGVLRAPWCGLALDDLHKLAGEDDQALLRRAIPDLLAERLSLLSEQGRRAATRVLHAVSSVPALRTALPTGSLGTWLQQVWLSLGGAHCVDATALANLDLLWSCLDGLPGGEQDLLSPALDAALKKLTALPDPAAGESGVQLMTIHKSKGLEFELVIVPELQATGGRDKGSLLSWLERGLAEPDGSGEITEFLVAPVQAKGTDRSEARAWVDRVRSLRESEEMRRILYVAATRARDELHFFARPAYKDDHGSLSLVEPKNSLLATAWPAFQAEVTARFEEWKESIAGSEPAEDQLIESIAASGADAGAGASPGNLLVMPSPRRPAILRRLPADFEPPLSPASSESASSLIGSSDMQSSARHEGGLLSRALGNAVHKLLEELARLRGARDWTATRAALVHQQSNIAAQIRAAGVPLAQAESIAAKAFDIALKASHDPHGQWILSPRAEAASEASWAGIVAGGLRTVRVDRIFRAGFNPLSEGADAWWIIDYKTAHADHASPDSLPQLRKFFAPQLESYAEVVRNLHGKDTPIRAALYYPRMLLFDWWEI